MTVYYLTVSQGAIRNIIKLPLTGEMYLGYTMKEAKSLAKEAAARKLGLAKKEIKLKTLDNLARV